MQEKIENVLDKIRPVLLNDDGDIEFVKYEDGVCYLRFLGHCATCPMMLMTLNDLIKDSLVNEIPEIVDVKLVSDM